MDLNNNPQLPFDGEQKDITDPAEAPESNAPENRLRKLASDIFEILEMFTVCASVSVGSVMSFCSPSKGG
jgi:hypothetical protein